MTNEVQQFMQTEVNILHGFIYFLDKKAEIILRQNVDIGYPDFLLMMMLDVKQPCSQQEISEQMGVTKSSVSKRVEALHQKGLLVRQQDPNNRRKNTITLTEKGLQVIKQSYHLLHQGAEPYFAQLGDKRASFQQAILTLWGGIEHDHHY